MNFKARSRAGAVGTMQCRGDGFARPFGNIGWNAGSMAKFRNRAAQRAAIEASRKFHVEEMANGWSFKGKRYSFEALAEGARQRMVAVDAQPPESRSIIYDFELRALQQTRNAPETSKRLKALQKKFPKAPVSKLWALAIRQCLEEAQLSRQFEKTG